MPRAASDFSMDRRTYNGVPSTTGGLSADGGATMPNLVARTTWSLRRATALPMISSLGPYTSAVSIRVVPSSTARLIRSSAVSSVSVSLWPYGLAKLMAP